MVATWYADDGLHLNLRRWFEAKRRRAWGTGKAGANGQHSEDEAAAPGQDRRLPGVVTHPRPQRAPARCRVETREPGSGSPAGRTPSKYGDTSMYSLAYVRTWRKSLWQAHNSSVAASDRGQ